MYNDLSKIFKGVLEPINVSFLFNSTEYEDYKCLYSSHDRFKAGFFYNVYSIPSLLRLLVLRNKVLTEKLIENFYQEERKEVCFILDWKNESKKVLIFDFHNVEIFNQDLFYQILAKKKEMEILYQKAFTQFQRDTSNADT